MWKQSENREVDYSLVIVLGFVTGDETEEEAGEHFLAFFTIFGVGCSHSDPQEAGFLFCGATELIN